LPQAFAVTEIETAGDNGAAVPTAMAARPNDDAGTNPGALNQTALGTAAGPGPGRVGTGSNGYGVYGTGSGSGSGNRDGSGAPGNAVASSQARYRDTPRPEYPESARREGREGLVLLRVLVDDQGRSKKVEISGSSGSSALDRAAAEAIRRWRFHPALHGDAPTESWVNIPVDFRLKDQK
jgi:protein TonB